VSGLCAPVTLTTSGHTCWAPDYALYMTTLQRQASAVQASAGSAEDAWALWRGLCPHDANQNHLVRPHFALSCNGPWPCAWRGHMRDIDRQGYLQ